VLLLVLNYIHDNLAVFRLLLDHIFQLDLSLVRLCLSLDQLLLAYLLYFDKLSLQILLIFIQHILLSHHLIVLLLNLFQAFFIALVILLQLLDFLKTVLLQLLLCHLHGGLRCLKLILQVIEAGVTLQQLMLITI
jgi:hypothetical protein